MLPLLSSRSLMVLLVALSLAGCQLALENRTPDDSDLDLDDVWQQYASPLTEEELFEEVVEGALPTGSEPTIIDTAGQPEMPSPEGLIAEGTPDVGTREVLDLPDEIPADPLAGIPPPLTDGRGSVPMGPARPIRTPAPIRNPAPVPAGSARIGGGIPPPPPPPQWDPSLDRRVSVSERDQPADAPTTVTGPRVVGPSEVAPPEDGSGIPDSGFLEPTETELANLDPLTLPGPGEAPALPGPDDARDPIEDSDPLCPPTGDLPSPLDAQPQPVAPIPAPMPPSTRDPLAGILPHHPATPGDGPIGPGGFPADDPEELPIGSVRPRQPVTPLAPAPESKPAESSQDLGAPPTGDLPVPTPRVDAPDASAPRAPVAPAAPAAPTAGTEEDPWATPAPLPALPAPGSPGEEAPAAPAAGTDEDPWATPAPAQPAGTDPAPAPAAPSAVDDDPWGNSAPTPAAPAGTPQPTGFVSDTREGKALEQVTRLLDAPGDPRVKGYPDEIVPKAEAWVALRPGPRPLVVVFHDDALRTSDRMAAEILPVLARFGPRVDVVTVDRNPGATRNEFEQQAVESFLGDSDDVPVTIVTDEERKRLLVKFGWFPAEELEAVLRDALGETAAAPDATNPRRDPLLDPDPPTGSLPNPTDMGTPGPLDPLPAPGQTPPPSMTEPSQPSTPRDEYRFTAPQAAQAKAHADRLRASPTDRRIGGYPTSLVRRANPRVALEPGHRPVVILFHDDTSRASNLQAADLLEAIVEVQEAADFVVIDVAPGATRTPEEQKVYKPYYPGIVPSTIVLSPARGPVKLWFQRTSAKSLRGALREAASRR